MIRVFDVVFDVDDVGVGDVDVAEVAYGPVRPTRVFAAQRSQRSSDPDNRNLRSKQGHIRFACNLFNSNHSLIGLSKPT